MGQPLQAKPSEMSEGSIEGSPGTVDHNIVEASLGRMVVWQHHPIPGRFAPSSEVGMRQSSLV